MPSGAQGDSDLPAGLRCSIERLDYHRVAAVAMASRAAKRRRRSVGSSNTTLQWMVRQPRTQQKMPHGLDQAAARLSQRSAIRQTTNLKKKYCIHSARLTQNVVSAEEQHELSIKMARGHQAW